jgi:predicted phosphoadenosine phosphosulfate sulfurtransferase
MEHPAREPDMGIPEFDHCIMRKNECLILGLRTQESLRRYQVCTAKKNDNYIAYHGGYSKAYPIYDWSSVDVWKLVQIEGIDYNRTYDELNRTCLFNNFLGQRVCPPFGDEPLRGLWKYAECWPDLWHKMVKRVPGVNTAWRYANTELYSNTAKPENLTWYEYVELLVANHTEQEVREHIQRRIKELIGRHEAKTDDPLDDEIHHPLSGCSWKFLAAVAAKGDLKNREQQKMLNCANQTLRKLGITLDEARKRYGKK